MNELLDIIVDCTAEAFGFDIADLCTPSRRREIVAARKAAAWLCRSEGIPARLLSERFCATRWSINRMQTEAAQSDDVWFWRKVNEARNLTEERKHIKSTED